MQLDILRKWTNPKVKPEVHPLPCVQAPWAYLQPACFIFLEKLKYNTVRQCLSHKQLVTIVGSQVTHLDLGGSVCHISVTLQVFSRLIINLSDGKGWS